MRCFPRILLRVIFIAVVIAFCCTSGKVLSAEDGKPFIHKFGELRVYYKDWLVVCDKNGEGDCRMVTVNVSGADRFFGRSELTVFPEQSGKPGYIRFYCSGAPKLEKTSVKVKVGETMFELRPDVDIFNTNTLETYDIKGPSASSIVEKMKAGGFITFQYEEKEATKNETFSLRGMAKSWNFVEDRILKRQK